MIPFPLTYPDPSLIHIKNRKTGEEAWIPSDSAIPRGDWYPVYDVEVQAQKDAAFCWLCLLFLLVIVWYLTRGR